MNRCKEFVKLQIGDSRWYKTLMKIRKDTTAKIVLFGTPIHGNLGDHAIAEEEKAFLKDFFPEYHVYEIIMPLYHTFKKRIVRSIREEDIICISGGGWMGNLWIQNEITIREIIQFYPNNLIVIFPQTVYYTDDADGEKESKRTSEIVSQHKNLQIFLRDEKSFEFVKAHYKFTGSSGAMLFPDMVLYGSRHYTEKHYVESSKLVNICLRTDCEAVIRNRDKLIENIRSEYSIQEITTVLPRWVPLKNREKELMLSWNEFAEAQLTITDRLHAMLFSVLNGTPCIVLDNKTGKVFGVSSWIAESGMVLQAPDAKNVPALIPEAMKMTKCSYNRELLSDKFKVMAKKIRENADVNRNEE